MSEVDCHVFGFPPDDQNECHANFWSLNENGQKIRDQIRQRLIGRICCVYEFLDPNWFKELLQNHLKKMNIWKHP